MFQWICISFLTVTLSRLFFFKTVNGHGLAVGVFECYLLFTAYLTVYAAVGRLRLHIPVAGSGFFLLQQGYPAEVRGAWRSSWSISSRYGISEEEIVRGGWIACVCRGWEERRRVVFCVFKRQLGRVPHWLSSDRMVCQCWWVGPLCKEALKIDAPGRSAVAAPQF